MTPKPPKNKTSSIYDEISLEQEKNKTPASNLSF